MFCNLLWLTLWYCLCAGLIFLFQAFYNLLNRPRFRDCRGDITTEVGYEEDPCGRIIETGLANSGADNEAPHVQAMASGTKHTQL